jgi:hypothetical protein
MKTTTEKKTIGDYAGGVLGVGEDLGVGEEGCTGNEKKNYKDYNF